MRILIIDDDSGLARLYQQILTCEGFEVETAMSLSEVLPFFEGPDVPSVVLMDCCMPGMDGAKLIDELLSRFPDLLGRVKIIGMSSLPPGTAITLECEKRVVEFVQKPDDSDVLIALIKHHSPASESVLVRPGRLPNH